MNDHPDRRDRDLPLGRPLELTLDRALQGLDAAELVELMALRARGSAVDPALALEVELAAAALEVARVDATDLAPLPADLAERVARQVAAPVPGSRAPSPAPRRFARRAAPWLGWVAAAALVAVVARDRMAPPPAPLGGGPPPVEAPADPFRSGRSAPLLASAHPLASGAGGILAWDQGRQEGALRVEGLAPVDPATGCYQLWIFDADRDARYPVDGGTFTVARGGPSRAVAVRPRVAVRRPTLFAVTLEPPGGVVVSDRARVLLTAAWAP